MLATMSCRAQIMNKQWPVCCREKHAMASHADPRPIRQGHTDERRLETIEGFWAWLLARRAEIDQLSSADDPFWDVLLSRLQDIDDGLWFEVSAPGPGDREFIITAEGRVHLFPLVEAIGAAAPRLPGWTVVALKQPMGFGFSVRYEGVSLDPAEMWFQPLVDKAAPEVLGLRVAVPGYTSEQEQEFGNGVLVLLDTALGERSAATDIDVVEVCELPLLPDEEGFIELPELMNYIEWRKHRLAGHA
jgi:hypothetical protein